MKHRCLVWNVVKIAVLAISIVTPVSAADFKKGLKAFNSGNYVLALAEWAVG